MTKEEKRVIAAAMAESRADLARYGQFERMGDEASRMRHLAGFSGKHAARRLRACAALARRKR